MATWWARRVAGRRTQAGGGVAPSVAVAGGGAPLDPTGATTQPIDADRLTAIDLAAGAGWAARIEPDPVWAAELAALFRARAARLEAQRDLLRLRDRHWSGERVIEEGRTEIEWWEHPDADPYAVLGLLPGARVEEAASARRRVAQQCHPDRLAPDEDPEEALRRMVAANAAYDRIRRALHPV